MFTGNKLSLLATDDSAEVNLNVTPLIDILTCLLFFLLLSFGAIIVALINVTVPALSEGVDSNTPVDNSVKITLSISVSDKGMFVAVSSDQLGEDKLKEMQKTFPMKDGKYDFVGLNDHLFDLKKKYPESDSVVIVPAPEIPYEVLIQVLDSSREREETIDNRSKRIPLFTGAVVSTIVQ